METVCPFCNIEFETNDPFDYDPGKCPNCDEEYTWDFIGEDDDWPLIDWKRKR
jgi:Zn-finger nucleic acid-binding protein